MNIFSRYFLVLLLPFVLFANQKTLIITGDKNYAPYTYLDAYGKPQGLLVDVWSEWSKVTGTKVKFDLKDWVQSMDAIKNKTADIHSGIYGTSLNTLYLDTIHRTKVSLFATKGYKEKLSHQKVGAINPTFANKLKEDYPNVEIVMYDNYNALFNDITDNKLELFFDATEPVLAVTTKTDLDALGELISSISYLVHFLQEERGASSGHISSNGDKFKSKLAAISKKTNFAHKKLLSYLKEQNTLLEKYLIANEYEKMDTLFHQIVLLRQEVDNLTTDFPKIYSKYTQVIASLLLRVSDLSDKVKNQNLSDKLYAYSTLLMYKESIGQKRASLNGLFSQNVFSKEIYEYFLSSDTQEKIYLKSFLRNADAASRESYYKTLDYVVSSKVKEYERLALEKLEGKKVNVQAEDWFEAATTKINLVQDVEKVFYKHMLSNIDKLNRKTLENRTVFSPYQIVPLEKEYFFDIKAASQDKEVSQTIKEGFLKIPQKTLHTIEKQWINEKHRFHSKKFSPKPDAKNLNIAFHFDKPPYIFDKTSSKGIDVDLIREAFLTQGYTVNISQMRRTKMDKLLKNNPSYDAVASVSDTGDGMYYSNKYSLYRDYVITRKKDKIKINSFDDLAKYDFLSWKHNYNDLGEKFYSYFNPNDGVHKEKYNEITSQKELHQLFFAGEMDALVVDKKVFQWYKMHLKNNEEYTFHDILPLPTNSFVRFRDRKIRDIFNQGLQIIKANNRYEEIVNFYLTQDIQVFLQYSNIIADISGKFIFSSKAKVLEGVLKEFFQHPDIVAIDVFDKTSNHNFVSLFRKDSKIISKKSDEALPNLPSFIKDIYFIDKGHPLLVGKVEIFYKKDFDEKHGELIPKIDSFTQVTVQEINTIKDSFAKDIGLTKDIGLSKEEKEWIRMHPSVTFAGDPNWLPFEAFNEDGAYIGIVAEHLSLLESIVDIKFEKKQTASWSDSLDLAKNGKVDVISGDINDDLLNKYFNPIKPYINSSIIIMMHEEEDFVNDLSELMNKKIALIKGYGYLSAIYAQYPDFNFIEVENVQDGLLGIASGKYDAMLGSLALMSYTKKEMGFSELKIVGKIDIAMHLTLFISKEKPILFNVISKSLQSISKVEQNKILSNWTQESIVERIDYELLYKVVGVSIILILLFVFWNIKMAKEIAKRKILEEKMEETQERLNLTIAGSGDGLWEIDHIRNTLWWSPQFKEMLGYTEHKLHLKPEDWVNYLYPEDTQIYFETYSAHIEDGADYDVMLRMLHKDGSIVWLHARAKTLRDDEDNVIRTSGSVTNVTELKESQAQIEEQQQQFTSMVGNVPGAIYRAINNSSWPIIYVSDEIRNITGYPAKDFMDSKIVTFSTIMHPDDVVPIGKSIQEQFSKGKQFVVDYRIISKSGEIIWVKSQGSEIESEDGESWIDGVLIDITEQKELEFKIQEQKRFTQKLLDSQEQLIITTDGESLITANKTFLDFFAIDNVEDFIKEYDSKCVCDTFNTQAPQDYLQIQMGRESWIDYVISRPYNTTHKAMITIGETDFIFSVTAAKLPDSIESKGMKSAVFTDITAMENAQKEIEFIHKHTRESIEYASLIQGALIPDNIIFKNYFQDYFAIWNPKDIIGGDIYLFEELRDADECLLMVIDCTGHGVPGAFVTMLVKAIERQIIGKINNDHRIDVSPAWILAYFNRSMKTLLKQNDKESISNAGFDGGIIYFNKKTKVLKFAGAETPLFYVEDNELLAIKGNRHSIGYKKSDRDYEFTDHVIKVKEGMQFYLTTDGYLDQNGGEKSFSFGKKAFKKIITECSQETMADQEKIFLKELDAYQGDEETNDDVTLVGFKV